jgi:hypothetical protein
MLIDLWSSTATRATKSRTIPPGNRRKIGASHLTDTSQGLWPVVRYDIITIRGVVVRHESPSGELTHVLRDRRPGGPCWRMDVVFWKHVKHAMFESNNSVVVPTSVEKIPLRMRTPVNFLAGKSSFMRH